MSKRISPRQREIDGVLEKKKIADERWDEFMRRYRNGTKFAYAEIAHYIGDCNRADQAFNKLGLKI
jgi:hypothetical protein